MENNRTLLIILVVLALIGLAFFATYTMRDRDSVRDTSRDAGRDTSESFKEAGRDLRD